jgi:hypothetical protein
MPFSAHSDLLFIHYFPSFLTLHGVWDIYGYIGAPQTYYPPLLYFWIAAFQKLFLSQPSFASWMEHLLQQRFLGRFLSFAEWAPLPSRELWPLLFSMKLPYLAADGLCLLLAVKSGRALSSETAAKKWWLDPLLLIATYLIGQYRVIPCAALWLAVHFASRGKALAVFFALGLAALTDSFPFYLLLPSLLIFGSGWRAKWLEASVFAATVSLLILPLWGHSNGLVKYAYVSPVIQGAAGASLTRHYAEFAAPLAKALLAGVYALFHLYLIRKRAPLALRPVLDSARLWIRSAAVLLLVLLATSSIPIHYFLWVLPFWVLVRAEGEPWPRLLSPLAAALLLIFTLDKPELNLGLFAPFDAALSEAPGLHEFMDRFLPWGAVVGASRLLFSGLCLYFSWNLFTRRIRPILEAR